MKTTRRLGLQHSGSSWKNCMSGESVIEEQPRWAPWSINNETDIRNLFTLILSNWSRQLLKSTQSPIEFLWVKTIPSLNPANVIMQISRHLHATSKAAGVYILLKMSESIRNPASRGQLLWQWYSALILLYALLSVSGCADQMSACDLACLAWTSLLYRP